MLNYSIERILEIVGEGAITVGTHGGEINGIASLAEGDAGDLSFLGNSKYRSQVEDCGASVLLLPKDYEGQPGEAQLYILVDNPSYALALICRDIENNLYPRPPAGIHPTAPVAASAAVDPSASVGAFCYVAAVAQIGAQAVFENPVSLGRSARTG